MLDRTKVQEVIDKVRPFLQRDGGDVQLMDVTDDNVVKVETYWGLRPLPDVEDDA